MSNLTILIDENVSRVDGKAQRISFCVVEVAEQEVLNEVISKVALMKADKIRFADINKFHFSELSETQRSAVIEFISKLNITAKTYTYYCFNETEKESKIQCLQKTIEHLKRLHPNKKLDIRVEYAGEYKDVPELKKLLVKNSDIFIIADGFLAVFIGKLDNISRRQGSYDKLYQLIREKIRLQVFSDGAKKVYLTGRNRL